MRVSDNIRELHPSATLAVAALCRQMKASGEDVLDLSAGEPDFRTPDFASQAGISAIEQGSTHYPPVPGIAELREAIAAYHSRVAGRSIDPAGVVVSTGAKQALFNACFVLFGPGDDVLVPSPYWTSYPEILHLARARPVLVSGSAANALKVDVPLLEAAVSPATRGIILNSPSNPTGAVYTRDELDAIVRWAYARGLWIISDEIYSRLCFTADRAPGMLDLDEALFDRIVIIDGVSKSFAMTGWRIGFSMSTPQLAKHLSAVQSHITSGASTPAQEAALAAFQDEPRVEEAVGAMVRVFNRRRQNAADAVRELLPNADFTMPDGAFYLFIRMNEYYDAARPDSVAFCRALLEQTGVALVPGSAFGDDRYVRMSFAAPEAELLEGIRRTADFANGRTHT